MSHNVTQVKGTMIIDYVRLVRAHKDIDWNKWLNPEDWEVINNELLKSSRKGIINI